MTTNDPDAYERLAAEESGRARLAATPNAEAVDLDDVIAAREAELWDLVCRDCG